MSRFETVLALSKRDIGMDVLWFGENRGVSGPSGAFGPHGNSFKTVAGIINLNNDR